MATFNLNTPNIPDEADILTQLRQIRSYITNLNNQLRYDLSNIDEDNLTGGELPENAISRGFRQKVLDLQGNMSVFEQTATRILARVENAEGDISTLEQTANSLTSRISGVEGVNSTQQTEINQNKLDITLKASETTVTALAGRVTTAESSISIQAGQIALKAEKTVTDGLNTRLTSAEEKITPNAITATVRSHENYQSDLNAKNRTFVGGTPTGMIAGDLWIDSANGNLLKRYNGSAWAAVQDGAISIAQQQADKIQWLVASGTSAANMTLTSQLYSLMAANIDLSANNSVRLAVSVGGTNLMPGTTSENKYVTFTNIALVSLGSVSVGTDIIPGDTLVVSGFIDAAGGGAEMKLRAVCKIGSTWTAVRPEGNPVLTGRSATPPFVVPPDTTSIEILMQTANNAAVNAGRYYKKLQVERGTMATDWSPAPSDPSSGVKTSYIDIATDHIDISSGGKLSITSPNTLKITSGTTNATALAVRNDTDYFISAGHLTQSSAPFWVKKNGSIKATSGVVGGFTLSSGKLIDTATSGSKMEIDPVNGVLDVGDFRITQSSSYIDLFNQQTTGSTYMRILNTVGPISLAADDTVLSVHEDNFYAVGGQFNVDSLYSQGNVSALSFTDRTPAYIGDALSDLRGVGNDKHGTLDHKTLPKAARKQIRHTHKNKDESTEEREEEGRDIGMMVSILTKAIQQLTEIVEKQQVQINQLLGERT